MQTSSKMMLVAAPARKTGSPSPTSASLETSRSDEDRLVATQTAQLALQKFGVASKSNDNGGDPGVTTARLLIANELWTIRSREHKDLVHKYKVPADGSVPAAPASTELRSPDVIFPSSDLLHNAAAMLIAAERAVAAHRQQEAEGALVTTEALLEEYDQMKIAFDGRIARGHLNGSEGSPLSFLDAAGPVAGEAMWETINIGLNLPTGGAAGIVGTTIRAMLLKALKNPSSEFRQAMAKAIEAHARLGTETVVDGSKAGTALASVAERTGEQLVKEIKAEAEAAGMEHAQYAVRHLTNPTEIREYTAYYMTASTPEVAASNIRFATEKGNRHISVVPGTEAHWLAAVEHFTQLDVKVTHGLLRAVRDCTGSGLVDVAEHALRKLVTPAFITAFVAKLAMRKRELPPEFVQKLQDIGAMKIAHVNMDELELGPVRKAWIDALKRNFPADSPKLPTPKIGPKP